MAKQKYDRETIVSVVCGCLAQGKPLVQILTAEGMPEYATFMRWLAEDESIRDSYTRARESSADFLADEIVHIADNEPDPQVARVRIDARKWVAGKMKPKKYGDRVTNEHVGANGGPIVVHRRELSEEELMAIAAS